MLTLAAPNHMVGRCFAFMGIVLKGFSWSLLLLSILALIIVVDVVRSVELSAAQKVAMAVLIAISLFLCFASGVLLKKVYEDA